MLAEEKSAVEAPIETNKIKEEKPIDKSFEGKPYPTAKPVQTAAIEEVQPPKEPKAELEKPVKPIAEKAEIKKVEEKSQLDNVAKTISEAPEKQQKLTEIEEKDFVEQILNQPPGKDPETEAKVEIAKAKVSQKPEEKKKIKKPEPETISANAPSEERLNIVAKKEEQTQQKVAHKIEAEKPLLLKDKQKITDQSILEKENGQEPEKLTIAEPENTQPKPLKPLKTVDLKPVKAVPVEETVTADMPRREKPTFRDSPSNKIDVWNARRKTTLKDALLTWCAQEKIHCILKTKNMYELERDVFINGTFKNAIDILFSKGLRKPLEYKIVNDGENYRLVVQDDSATL